MLDRLSSARCTMASVDILVGSVLVVGVINAIRSYYNI